MGQRLARIGSLGLVVAVSACGALFGVDFKDVPRSPDGGWSGAQQPVDPPVPVGPDGTCAGDRKRCGDLCASKRDPAYGCADDTCSACASADATCSNGQCTTAGSQCVPGGATGCEFSCSSCTAPPHGKVDCSGARCDFTCDDGYLKEVDACTTTRITAGDDYTCAIRSDALVVCWGWDSIDRGTVSPPSGKFLRLNGSRVGCAGIACLPECGIKEDGSIVCWGDNGIWGDSPPQGTFLDVTLGAKYNYTVNQTVDASWVIAPNGTLSCFGGLCSQSAAPPTGSFRQVSSGQSVTCGLKTDGSIVCWNDYPSVVPPPGKFRQISVGEMDGCGIRTDGNLVCFGGGPQPPTGTFRQVSVGSGHACAVSVAGAITCWGANDDGKSTPLPGTYRQVSAGSRHTCAIGTDGKVVCWGNDQYGQATPPQGTFW
jgi:hypothetical protein